MRLTLAASVAAVAVALASSFLSRQQTDLLRREIATLRESYRQLAAQVARGRQGDADPVGQSIDVSTAPARGRADAVLTLIEFSDYECPFCIRHMQETMPLIDSNYIESGKIRYVFRDFPIDSNHPEAVRAHEAAHCALEQNKFWELHPLLFSAPGTHTPQTLQDRAKEAGLDVNAYRSCVAAGTSTPAIRESGSLAESLGATGTPWFFLGMRDLKTNQVRVIKAIGGAQPYEQFVVAIDAALKQTDHR
jgi:protein-disulfide isomerase